MKINNLRFGVMLAIVGFIYSLFDFSGNIITNIVILILSAVVISTVFSSLGPYIQVIIMSLVTLYTIYYNPYKSTFVLQLVLVFMILKKNGFLDRFFLRKIIYIIALFLINIFISLTIHNKSAFRFIPYLLLGAFLGLSILVLFREEINKFTNYKKILESELKSLNNKLEDTYENLRTLEENYINPVDAGLTNTELALLEDICIYRDTNVNIGKRLEKSQHTVKIQLGKIMSKIGAKNRYELVDMCKGYFFSYSNL